MRLLIVEDSPLVRRMYGLPFPRRDHELVEAENGQKALDALAASSQRFDLILLDLRMPDMDGVEFLRTVRRESLFNIPIIVTTSEPDSSELLQQAKALGVAAVRKKALETARPREARPVRARYRAHVSNRNHAPARGPRPLPFCFRLRVAQRGLQP